jgi:hypothetical protein
MNHFHATAGQVSPGLDALHALCDAQAENASANYERENAPLALGRCVFCNATPEHTHVTYVDGKQVTGTEGEIENLSRNVDGKADWPDR